ncbi:MAG: hypothetical protein QNJ36_09000 [Calothrix sp. MO_167.B42]|nr:hypothetical protein [Calothrix sp. MO_167.B42]
MDETKLTNTEIAAGVGVALAGFGLAGYVAVQALKPESQKTTPEPPQNSSSMTTTNH